MNSRHIKIGQIGESIAREYLEIAGYKIVEHNWRQNIGEIDLIALESRDFMINNIQKRFHVKHYNGETLELEGNSILIEKNLDKESINDKIVKNKNVLKMSFILSFILSFIFDILSKTFRTARYFIRNILDRYVKIVDYNKNQIIFIEVKTIIQSKESLKIRPEDNLTYYKKEKLLKTAKYYLANKGIPLNTSWRFDLIAIVIYDNNVFNLKHYQNIIFDIQ